MVRMLLAIGALALSAGCAGWSGPDAADGRALAESQCSACHAIGAAGASPRPDAPPLRTVLARYPAEPLADAFMEGLKVGHPDMPAFALTPIEADSLIAYLKTIQEPAQD